MNYTKGEWHVEYGGYRDNYHRYLVGTDNTSVALIQVKAHHKEMEANANLIAAAPILYRCLRDLIEWLDDDDKIVGNIEAIKRDCYIALAKAEGKEVQ